MSRFFELITFLGNWQIISALTALALIVFFIKRWKKEFMALLVMVILGEGIVLILKNLLQIPRPDTVNGALMMAERDYSFPSGHSFMAVVFYGFAAYLLSKYFDPFGRLRAGSAQGRRVDSPTRPASAFARYALIVALVLLILAIAFSRVYLGYHALWEVIGSLLMGLVWLTIVIRWLWR